MGRPERKQERYTYADYLTWEGGERCELIDGVPYMMASPSQRHQEILVEMGRQFANFLRGKPCKVFTSSFDVRLYPDSDDNTVVQPDLLVVCDQSKLDGKACNGAPDFVVEIVSPSTSRNDRVLKLTHYQWAGVEEYWIVYPEDATVEKYVLRDSAYVNGGRYTESEIIPVSILPGLEINLAEVFGEVVEP